MRIILLLSLVVLYAFPLSGANAARFYFTVPEVSGARMPVEVRIDTEGERLNAYEGTVSLFGSAVRVIRTEDAGSVITVWLEHPEGNSTIRFSGITPGGYLGEGGHLFTVLVEGENEARLSLNGVRAYRDDGQGTEAISRTETVDFSFGEGQSEEAFDSEKPEPFLLSVVKTSESFEGKRVLIFSAQDKGTGIARFEVCEGLFSCAQSESPHILKNQSESILLVRAYDFSGNSRLAFLYTDAAQVYTLAGFGALILILGAGAYFVRRRFHAN